MPTYSSRYQIMDDAVGGVWDFQRNRRVTERGDPTGWKEWEAALSAGEVPLPASPLGQMTLEEAKAQRLKDIDAYAASLRNSFTRGRSAGEMSGWVMKLLDAMARQAHQPSPFVGIMPALQTALSLPSTPDSICHAMAMMRGITEAEYVAKVMRDAVSALVAEVATDGVRGKHADSVPAITTLPELLAQQWREGWPTIT